MKLTKQTLKRIINEELNKLMNEGVADRAATRIGAGIGAMTDGGDWTSLKAKESASAASNQIGELLFDLSRDAKALGIPEDKILLGELGALFKEFMEAPHSVSEGITDRISSRIGGAVGAVTGGGYESSKVQDFQNATSNRIAQLGYALKNDEKKLELPEDTMGSKRVLAIAAKLKKMATKDL